MKYLKLLPQVLCVLAFCHTSAQNGTWNPAGANLTHPRTLLKATDVAAVQQSLATPDRHTIYTGLYNSINTTIPAGNTTSGERRNRAAFAKNTAFVLLMHQKPAAGGTLAPLTSAEHANFAGNVKTLLENINTAVETFSVFSSSYTEWQWRSKELIDYMIAYDLLRGAGEPVTTLEASRAALQAFAGNLYRNSVTPSFSITFYSVIKNNHALMTAAALGLSAVVLPDITSTDSWKQPIQWINTGLYNMDNVLWRDASRQSNPTVVAGYAEGPYYFKYAFLNCLPFIRSMGNFLPDESLAYTYNNNSRSIRNPYHDPSYDLLYDWIAAIQLPDGRFPALEDSFIDMGMPELALTGKSHYVHPMYFSKLAPAQLKTLVAQLSNITVDMRAAFLAANLDFTSPRYSRLTSLPVSGNLVFRSGNDSLTSYLHLYGKNGLAQSVTGGHSQGDASSFILHAGGQLLALDPGYLSSGRRTEVGEGVHHNLLLVDGAGPAIGSAGSANDAEAFIQNTFTTDLLSYGEVRTTYRAANITRKTIFVRNSYYLLADVASSTSARTFTWQLHGYGLEGGTAATGTFSDSLASHNATWHKNAVNLKAHVTAIGGASGYGKATNIHELSYNTPESHTTLQVHKSNVTQTQFLSLLYPYTTAAAKINTQSDSRTAALTATEAGYRDLAFAQADTSLVTHNGLPEPVTSDALLTFFSVSADGLFAQAFAEQGRHLQFGNQTVFSSTKRATISWQKKSATEFAGYTSRATDLTIPLEKAPATVTGTGISSYSYNEANQSLQLRCSGPSHFQVTLSTVLGIEDQQPLPVNLLYFTVKRQPDQVLLNWATATETDNLVFEVWRKAEGEKAYELIGQVPGAGNSSVAKQYAFKDKTAPATTLYYRLKQLDRQGSFAYSPVVALREPNLAPSLFSLAPVPADTDVTVHYADAGQKVQVRLLSAQGQLLQQQTFKQQAVLDTRQLPEGLYLVQLINQAGVLLAPAKKLLIRH